MKTEKRNRAKMGNVGSRSREYLKNKKALTVDLSRKSGSEKLHSLSTVDYRTFDILHSPATVFANHITLIPLLLLTATSKLPFLPITSTNSVFGSKYGFTFSLTIVLCSNAYANPINISSLHKSPKKLIPNGIFGPVSTNVPRIFLTTVSLAGYAPRGTVITGAPIRAGRPGAKFVGRMRASRE